MITAILSNPLVPSYGVVSIPMPIPNTEYDNCINLLKAIEVGDAKAYRNRTHFSPIWMPNGGYTVNTWLIDAWTPAGMLCANLTDSLTISGSLWDDWHVAAKSPK